MWFKKQKGIKRKRKEKNDITQLELYTKDMKANCEEPMKFMYKNPTQQNKAISEPYDIHYDAFWSFIQQKNLQ